MHLAPVAPALCRAPAALRLAGLDAERAVLARLPLPVRFASGAHLLQHFARDVLEAHAIPVRYDGALPDGPVVLAAGAGRLLDALAVLAGIPSLPLMRGGDAPPTVLDDALRALDLDLDRDTERAALAGLLGVLRAGTSVTCFAAAKRAGGASTADRVPFLAARAAGVPVVPVAVRYEARELSRGAVALDAAVTFGRALDPASFPDARSLGRAARAVVGAL